MYIVEKSEDFLYERDEILSQLYTNSLSQKITQKLFNDIESKILLLKIFPDAYQKRASEFRIIPIQSYSILYKTFPNQKLVRIYSIVHSASNFVEYK